MNDESTTEREQRGSGFASPTLPGKGRAERALARLYAHLGWKVAVLVAGGGYVFGLITMAVALAGGGRYLGISVSQVLGTWPLLAGSFLLGVIGLAPSAGLLSTVFAWRDEQRTTDLAPDVWHAIVGWRDAVTRVVLTAALAIVPSVVYMVIHFHKPWYAAPAAAVGLVGVLAGLWAVTAFSAELVLRPMLEDVAAHLPPDFEPQSAGMSLRTKGAASLPAVTFFAALLVGAYANLFPNGTLRAILAIGVALCTVVVATIIFLIINRSVLSPIDDLTAATERVQAGDIVTPVRVLSDDELGALAVGFNRMLAELRRRTDELRASRERIVATADEERRRMERDLHDGAQQRLVLAQLKLGLLERGIDGQPEAAKHVAAELRGDLEAALAELRDLAHGLYPPLLESDGLAGALREAVERAAIPARFECQSAGRYRAELEAAVYFCCLEALQNAAKHAGEDARATVRLVELGGNLNLEISDNGRGFRANGSISSSGIQNMSDRVGALGGELRVDSAPGRGTTVAATIPLRR